MSDGSTSDGEWTISGEVDCESTTSALVSGVANYTEQNNTSTASNPNAATSVLGETNGTETWTNSGSASLGIDAEWADGQHTSGDEIYLDSLVIQRMGPS